jgi:hypothetical protein
LDERASGQADKVEGVEPKVEVEIRRCVAEIAEKRYPRVWVGKAGITTEELLHLQELNEEGPDWLRIELGEPFEFDGMDVGSLVPDVSVDWIKGGKALRLIPDHFVEGELGNLQAEVEVIRAAKAGAVMVHSAFTIAYAVCKEVDALSEDDRLSIRAEWPDYDGRPAAMFYSGSTYRMVPLDELTGDDVDEHLLETLDFYAGDTFEPYVVEDTPRSRALVELRLGG